MSVVKYTQRLNDGLLNWLRQGLFKRQKITSNTNWKYSTEECCLNFKPVSAGSI